MYGSHSFPDSCGPFLRSSQDTFSVHWLSPCNHSYSSTENKVAKGVFSPPAAAMEAGHLPAAMNKFLLKNI